MLNTHLQSISNRESLRRFKSTLLKNIIAHILITPKLKKILELGDK